MKPPTIICGSPIAVDSEGNLLERPDASDAAVAQIKETMRVAKALIAVARPMCKDNPFKIMSACLAVISIAASIAPDPDRFFDAAIDALQRTRGLADPPPPPETLS